MISHLAVCSFFRIPVFQGLSATEELWKIALTCTDLTICNSIFEELQASTLSGEHRAMVTFFKELNELYPCRDFDQLKTKHKYIRERYPIHLLHSL